MSLGVIFEVLLRRLLCSSRKRSPIRDHRASSGFAKPAVEDQAQAPNKPGGNPGVIRFFGLSKCLHAFALSNVLDDIPWVN